VLDINRNILYYNNLSRLGNHRTFQMFIFDVVFIGKSDTSLSYWLYNIIRTL